MFVMSCCDEGEISHADAGKSASSDPLQHPDGSESPRATQVALSLMSGGDHIPSSQGELSLSLSLSLSLNSYAGNEHTNHSPS